MNDREIRLHAARQWGEKAAWDDGEPKCPYIDVAASAAWWEGYRAAKRLKEQLSAASNCATA